MRALHIPTCRAPGCVTPHCCLARCPPAACPPPCCRDNRADTAEDKAFDVLTRELVFEAKAKPGERTLTGGWGGMGCTGGACQPETSRTA